MPVATPHFDAFVARLHRRHVGIRLLESAALALAWSGLFILLILAWQLWGGTRQHAPLVWIAPAAVVFGVIGRWVRRPTMLASVVQADRQLAQDDLLATVLLTGTRLSSDRPFEQSVAMAAENSSQALHPSRVRLNRVSARGWGALALLWALILSLWMGTPPGTAAQERPGGTQAELISAASQAGDRPLIELLPQTSGPVARPDPDDLAASKIGQDQTPPHDPPEGATPQPDAPSRKVASSAGGGAGQAQTHAPQPLNDGHLNRLSDAQPPSRGDNTSQYTGSGPSAPSTLRSGDGSTSGGVISGYNGEISAAPWRSSQWPADIDRARQSLTGSEVPSVYRQLIRDYFQ